MDSSRVVTVLKKSVVSVGASAVAGGAWALVPVGRARGLTRALLVVVPAAAGGVVAFTHRAALALDHGVEALLVRRGVWLHGW